MKNLSSEALFKAEELKNILGDISSCIRVVNNILIDTISPKLYKQVLSILENDLKKTTNN